MSQSTIETVTNQTCNIKEMKGKKERKDFKNNMRKNFEVK